MWLAAACSPSCAGPQGPAELLPEEYDSANLQAARNRAQTRTQRMAGEREARDRSLRRTVDEDGVTWGMSMEEVADVDEDGAASKGTAGELREVDVDDANERDRKLFARVEAKRLKIENLQSEIGRIRAKEVQGELTAGARSRRGRCGRRCSDVRVHVRVRAMR